MYIFTFALYTNNTMRVRISTTRRWMIILLLCNIETGMPFSSSALVYIYVNFIWRYSSSGNSGIYIDTERIRKGKHIRKKNCICPLSSEKLFDTTHNSHTNSYTHIALFIEYKNKIGNNFVFARVIYWFYTSICRRIL